MPELVPQALRSWAALPGPAKLLVEARVRLQRNGVVSGTFGTDLDPVERQQVGRLLGLSWAATDAKPKAKAVHAALEARGTTLLDLVLLSGPLVTSPQRRAEQRTARADGVAAAHAVLTKAGVSGPVASWALRGRRTTTVADRRALADLVQEAAAVLERLPLPAGQAQTLAVLAAEVLDDPHALDNDTDLGRLLPALITAQAEAGTDPGCDIEVRVGSEPLTNRLWRQAWESQGVWCDRVSSMVLILGLRLGGSGAAAVLSRQAAQFREPLWLSLRSLDGGWDATPLIGRTVYVCENPAIVEEAASRLECTAPLICTYGWPSDAALDLLGGIAATGAALVVRADDDPAGQRIVTRILQAVPSAGLWRYERRSPEAAFSDVVYEEQMVKVLMEDLSAV